MRCSRNMGVMAAVAAGLAVAGGAQAAVVNVNMLEMTFSVNGPGQPEVWPTINVGDTIRWTIVEGAHTTQSIIGSTEVWESPFLLNVGDTFEHTFNNPGVFSYYCLIHGFDNGDGTAGGMWGTITVVPAPGAAGVLAGVGLLAARRPRRRA